MDSDSNPHEEKLGLTDLKVCGGPAIEEGDTVRLLYRVAFSEQDIERGNLLESNYNPEDPIEIVVSKEALLEGVFRGLIGMRAGGSVRRVVVPPHLAFGSRAWGRVPPNTTLVVDLLVSLVIKPSDS